MLAIDNKDIIDYCKKSSNKLAASVAFSFTGGTPYASAPTVTITGGGGSGATAVATISNGMVTGVNITAAGTGYTTPPTIGFTGGGGTGATATSTLTGGGLGNVAVTNGGGAGSITFTDQTTYISPDARKNVNISVFDKFGHKAEVQIPAGSASVTLSLGQYQFNKTEGLSAIATVVSTTGNVKDGSVHNIATLLTSGNFVMEY